MIMSFQKPGDLLSLGIAAALLVGSTVGMASAAETRDQDERRAAVHQLRIYEIFEHNKAAFHARFRDHAARIMQRHGFTIVAMWEAPREGRTEFVYLLQWPDEAAMKVRWDRFMADEEWSAIKRTSAAEHGQLVGDIQSRVLSLTDYSPAL
jgi:heme-degrading monooxygenase HmoA